MGLPPLDAETDTSNIPGLLREGEAPDSVFVNDFTNPLLDTSQELPQQPAELDKALRDAGDFPDPPDTLKVRPAPPEDQGGTGRFRGEAPMEVVGFDSEGNRLGRIFRGGRSQAERIAERGNQAIQRVRGGNPEGPEEPRDDRSVMQRVGDLLRTLAGGMETGREIAGEPSAIPEGAGTAPTDFLESVGSSVNEFVQSLPTQEDVFTGVDLEQDEVVTEETENERQAAEGGEGGEGEAQETPEAQASPVADLLAPAGVRGRDLERLIAGAEPVEGGPSEEQVQDAREAAEGEGIGAQINEAFADPRLQRGLAQLSQLFGRPEDAHQQVARSLEEQTTQQIEAEQIRALLRGEPVENIESPSVVQTARDIEAQGRQLDIQQQNADTRRGRLNLARAQALQEAIGGGDEDVGLTPNEDRGAERAMQSTAADFFSTALQRGFEGSPDMSMGERISLLRLPDGGFDPIAVMAHLPDDARQQFAQEVKKRVVESTSLNPQQAENFFGTFSDNVGRLEEESGEGGKVVEAASKEDLSNAGPRDTVRVTSEIQWPDGKTLPPGSYRVDPETTLLTPIE